MADLDQMLNLLGERLGSWGGRDAPELAGGPTLGAGSLIERILKEEGVRSFGVAELDPDLAGARRNLAELFRAMTNARQELEAAVERMIPRATPNLTALLGPLLAARLLSKAGGLDRLARLPASTIQVLGAERAFFEHLRGRAPPPRHGILFLHSEIQGAPRRTRGKLARALAGKVAIAARKDRMKAPVDPTLAQAFRRRVLELQPQKGRMSPRSAVEP
jgi:nucleolar protein 56